MKTIELIPQKIKNIVTLLKTKQTNIIFIGNYKQSFFLFELESLIKNTYITYKLEIEQLTKFLNTKDVQHLKKLDFLPLHQLKKNNNKKDEWIVMNIIDNYTFALNEIDELSNTEYKILTNIINE